MTKTERLELWKHELDLNNWKYDVVNNNTIVYSIDGRANTFIYVMSECTIIRVTNIGHINEDQYGHMMFAINRRNGDIGPFYRYYIDDKDQLIFEGVCLDIEISFGYLTQHIYGKYCSPEAIAKHLAE